MAKALGSELTEFCTNHFPEGYCHDEFNKDIDPENFNPTQKYDLRNLRYIIPDGEGEARSFSSVFLKWKKTQTHETFLVTVPKESVAKAKADIKALGYSVP